MFFADDLEFVRNIYARNGLIHPNDPTDLAIDTFVCLEDSDRDVDVEISDNKIKHLKVLSKIGLDEVSVYTPGYVNRRGRQIKGYFRTVKVK